MRIEKDQSYDITLTVTTPAGTDSKTIKSMIKGSKPVPEDTGVEEAYINSRALKLISGNSVEAGKEFIFSLQNIGSVEIKIYSTNGKMVFAKKGSTTINVPTERMQEGVYLYIAIDDKGYKYTGKLLVKE